MNSLSLMSWSLLAQVGRIEELGGRFRHSRHNLSSQDLFIAGTAIALAAIGIWLLARHSNRESGRLKSRRLLFRELCRLHDLDWSSQRLLRKLACAKDLDHPIELFVSESHFQPDEIPARLQSRRDEFAQIQTVLFCETAAPEDEAAESDTLEEPE